MEIKNLEKFLDYISDKVENCYKKEVEVAIKDFLKETAQEVPAQEQYIGKCNNCNKSNEIQLPIGIKPKFCMECGKPILYQKNLFL
jgi:RNase P subunit RPR2